MTSQLREILTELGHIEAEISNFISKSQANSGLLKQLKDLGISEVNQQSKKMLLCEILTELGHMEAEISNFILISQTNSGLLKKLEDLSISKLNQRSKNLLLRFNYYFPENNPEITKLIIMLGKISKEFSHIEKLIIFQRNNQKFFHFPKQYLTIQLQHHLKTIREELNKLSPENSTKNEYSSDKSPVLAG